MQKVQQVIALTVVVILAIVAGGYFLLISPQHSQTSKLRSDLADAQQTSVQLQGKIQQLKKEGADLPAVQAALDAITKQMPADPSEPSLVSQLTAAATLSGVDLQVLDPGMPSPEAGTSSSTSGALVQPSAKGGTAAAKTSEYMAIPVKIVAVGNYFQVELFVHALEHLPRAMRVGTVAMQPGDPLAAGSSTSASGTSTSTSTRPASTPTSNKLTAQIQATVFMVPPATAATTPAGVTAHK